MQTTSKCYYTVLFAALVLYLLSGQAYLTHRPCIQYSAPAELQGTTDDSTTTTTTKSAPRQQQQ